VSSTSKDCTIETPSGPVEFPASVSPNGKFEGIDGRNIHGQIKSSTLYTQWAIRTIHRLKLREGKDYSRHSGAGPNGGATAEYLFSPKSTASILATARSRSESGAKIPAVVAQQDTKKLEEQIEAALPLLETLFGDEAALSVDARKLHAALAVRKDFTNWIKNQLQRGQWVEGRDYAEMQLQGINPTGGRPSRANTAGWSSVLLLGRRKIGFGIVLEQLRLELRLGQFIAFVKTVMRKQGVQVGIQFHQHGCQFESV